MPSGDETRQRLVDAATRAFADHGVHNASLLDITRQAGQRNRGAVHYHFQSRERLLVAVLEQQIGFLVERQDALLARAHDTPSDDLRSVVEALVRPTVELAESGWQGRCFLVIVGQLLEEDPAGVGPEIAEILQSTRVEPIFALIRRRLDVRDEEVLSERFALVANFITQSVANRARNSERTSPRRVPLATEDFVSNIVAMASGMLEAPVRREAG